MPKKIKPSDIKLRKYTIIMDAIESGFLFGYRRAHKHTDTPDENIVAEHVLNEIAVALDQVIDWEDE